MNREKGSEGLRQTKAIIYTWEDHLDAQANIVEWSEAVSRDGTLHHNKREEARAPRQRKGRRNRGSSLLPVRPR